jgi:phosphatidylserine decarboxylase
MKSTRLADLFYKMNINPFYVVSILVFLVPIGSFVLFKFIVEFNLWNSIGLTILVFSLCSILFLLYFNRSPFREVVQDEKGILSPADGIVVYVRQIRKGEIIESVKNKKHMQLNELLDIADKDMGLESVTGFIIGIELRLFDVHLIRSPITGRKILDHHASGRIVTMGNPGFECINDRETVVLKQEKSKDCRFPLHIAVVQIATFLARTVKSFVRDKINIVQGEPMGFIRLGSQVDVVVFSQKVNALVNVGDRVYGGITKIAEKSRP